jgi:hypothetical protein
MCKKLGFDVQAYDDLTYHDVVDKIEKGMDLKGNGEAVGV